jgi:transposase
VPDRACLTGIIFGLKSGIPWEMLPQELGCGSGMTCWRCLRDWQAAGVWDGLHHDLLDRLGQPARSTGAGRVWTAPASRPNGGECVGPNPTDRGKPGTQRHVVVERGGLPLAALLTGANRPASMVLEELLDAVPPIKTPAGRRRKRPAKGYADKGYAYPRCRSALRQRHIKIRIAQGH